MEYVITKNGESFELPKYTMKIAEKLEAVELQNQKPITFKSKCKAMYDLSAELLGKESVNTVLGKFEESDPNDINILFISIVNEYNKPLDQFNSVIAKEKMADIDIEKMTELLKSVSSSEKVFRKFK